MSSFYSQWRMSLLLSILNVWIDVGEGFTYSLRQRNLHSCMWMTTWFFFYSRSMTKLSRRRFCTANTRTSQTLWFTPRIMRKVLIIWEKEACCGWVISIGQLSSWFLLRSAKINNANAIAKMCTVIYVLSGCRKCGWVLAELWMTQWVINPSWLSHESFP